MIFVQEVHEVAGRDEDAFDLALREVWAPALAESGEARLVWALRQAHGTGPAYRVVTYTAVRSAAAWGDLAERAAGGDLRSAVDGLDRHRHASTATLLRPVSWSPLQELDLEAIPAEGDAAKGTLFMEDTAYPFREKLEDYLAQAGRLYAGMLEEGVQQGTSMLEMVAAFQPLWGTGPWRQVVLWQRVTYTRADHGDVLLRGARALQGPGHVDARRPGAAGPVGEPPPAHPALVAPDLDRGRARFAALRGPAPLPAAGRRRADLGPRPPVIVESRLNTSAKTTDRKVAATTRIPPPMAAARSMAGPSKRRRRPSRGPRPGSPGSRPRRAC